MLPRHWLLWLCVPVHRSIYDHKSIGSATELKSYFFSFNYYKSYNRKMKYLITGGAGFIGSNLADYLVDSGHKVIVVDDLSNGKKENVPAEADFYELDICETDRLAEVSSGADVIIHLAALPRVQFSIDEPFRAQRANVDGTLSVLEAARMQGVKRVVFASSSSVYGDQEVLPLHEDLPTKPKSPYALHKLMGEYKMRLWHELHGLETVSLRFFNIYGPKMDPDGAYALVIGKFLKMRLEGKPLTITGDGEQTRDFTNITDLIAALETAATSNTVGAGEAINIGASRNVSINDLAKLIGGPIEYIPARFEPKHTRADNRKAKELLGWEPVIQIEEGIEKLKIGLDLN